MKFCYFLHTLVVLAGLRVFAAPPPQARGLLDDLTEIFDSNLASTILHDIENAADCAGCDV